VTPVQGISLLDLLPDPLALGSWTKDGDHQLFEGDDLFIYIDGGAEIYLEYGFARVMAQDYKSEAGIRLSLEIFEMQSPESAYGMFTFKRSPGGEPLGLGDEGQLADYYLNFCKGRYLVTITGLDQAETVKEGLLALARGVDKRIKETASRPDLMSVLAEEDLLTPSLKLFRGPLGVSNSEPLLARIAMGMERGARGDYGSGWAAFVFSYPSRAFSQKKWAEAKAFFSDKQKFSGLSISGPVMSTRDEKGRSFFAQIEGSSIVFIIGRISRPEAEAQLDRAAAKLGTRPQNR
jgi:hypothetical protein